MEHYNRYQQTRFRNLNEEWNQIPTREREAMYRDNLKFYRERYHDPGHPSHPAPYAKNFEEQGELYDRGDYSYNDPAHYPIKRREFGHGESGNMNPGRMENYGRTSFRGFSNQPNTGRDYEQNIGYRENYNKLDTRSGPGYEYELAQSKRQQVGTQRGKGPRSYQRTDDRILEDINDRMCDNPYLDASDIEVRVEKGDIILTGTVEDRKAKRMAEDIGESISGVNNVENRLRVKIKGI